MRLRKLQWHTPLVLMALDLGLGGLAFGQSPAVRQVQSSPTCGECRIQLSETVTLDADSLAAQFAIPPSAARLPDGRIVVVTGDWRPLIFGPTGLFLTTIGRKGSGPGEFLSVGMTQVGVADSIHLFDWELGRHSVYAPDGTFVRSAPSPPRPFRNAVYLPNGPLVINSTMATPAGAGYPLHVINGEGVAIHAFGGEQRTLSIEDRVRLRRKLASAPNRKFWVASELEYKFERFNENGRLDLVLVGAPAWLRGPGRYIRPNPDSVFSPIINSVVEAADGSLRVLGWAPGPNWRNGWGEPGRRADGHPVPTIANFRELYTSIIEVLEIETGRLLARTEVPGFFLQFIDSEHLISYDETAEGIPIVKVWKLSLPR